MMLPDDLESCNDDVVLFIHSDLDGIQCQLKCADECRQTTSAGLLIYSVRRKLSLQAHAVRIRVL